MTADREKILDTIWDFIKTSKFHAQFTWQVDTVNISELPHAGWYLLTAQRPSGFPLYSTLFLPEKVTLDSEFPTLEEWVIYRLLMPMIEEFDTYIASYDKSYPLTQTRC